MAPKRLTLVADQRPRFDAHTMSQVAGEWRRPQLLPPGSHVFTQGALADSVFFLQNGIVKLSVASSAGKEAAVGIFGPHDFFGEACLAGQVFRTNTATAIAPCAVVQIPSQQMNRALQSHSGFAARFIAHILARNIRIEEDLIDQLFNSSEKRLARALLLLGQYDESGESPQTLPKLSQETLAEMIGTTRSRVNLFMNKFRRLGFIEYNGHVRIHRALLSVVLHE